MASIVFFGTLLHNSQYFSCQRGFCLRQMRSADFFNSIGR